VRFIESLRKFGYKGQIYPLHPSGGEVYGMKIYANVKDVPGPMDYVISAVSARYTPQLVADCAVKGVKAVHLFTSGYSEIEDEIGGKLEAEVLKIARKGGVRLIGPNCMGIYCPSSGMTFAQDFNDQHGFPKRPGPLGLISQSGGNSIYAVRAGSGRGVFFSKVISYGNAADLNETDFLEYMADDPDTRIIGMYIEGVKNGRRFMQALKRAAAIKPVIINKAGATDGGARACATHTSAVAGSAAIWQGLLKQAGAIQVDSMDELIDMSVTLLRLPLPAGKRAVVIGTGGGLGVESADQIISAGLKLPLLTPSIRKEICSIYGTEAGSMYRNPVDAPPFGGIENTVKAVSVAAASDKVDLLILHFAFDIWAMVSRSEPRYFFTEMIEGIQSKVKKPMAMVLHYTTELAAKQSADELQKKWVDMGLPVYHSIARAASAINRYIHWSRHFKGKKP